MTPLSNENHPTLAQLVEALEGCREVEKLISDIARPPRFDPDNTDAVMAATHEMIGYTYEAIVDAPIERPSDVALKARALLIMNDSTGGATLTSPEEVDADLMTQIIRGVASWPIGEVV